MGDTARLTTGLHADHKSRPHRRPRPPSHHHKNHATQKGQEMINRTFERGKARLFPQSSQEHSERQQTTRARRRRQRDTGESHPAQEWCTHLWLLQPASSGHQSCQRKSLARSLFDALCSTVRTFLFRARIERSGIQDSRRGGGAVSSSASSTPCCPVCLLPIRPVPTTRGRLSNPLFDNSKGA